MSLLTKRIPTIVGIALLVALAVGIFYYFAGKTTKVADEIVPGKVRITNVADNKFSVSWTTPSSTAGTVEYGIVGDKITTKAMDDRDGQTPGSYTTHHVTIVGLQPSTQYAFRILSGDKLTRFDNNGSPYTASTGPVIGATPTSANFYGNVQLPSKQMAGGSIVYLTLPGSATASTLVNESGNYAFTVSTVRSDDLRSYISYDPAASVASLNVDSGKLQSTVAVSLANSAPVPTITLGQNADFMKPGVTPAVAEVNAAPAPQAELPSPTPTAHAPTVFNVEPLAETDINEVSTAAVTLLNPKEEGETLKTLRPEFRGTGPKGITLSIALTGQKAVSDTVEVETDGTWDWAPVIDLKTGKQTITISYVGSTGSTQKLSRGFTISNSTTGLDPAFVSSPSASTTGSTSATGSGTTASSISREVMPATDSGVPTTGVIENTLLTAGLGIVIMVIGAALLAL